MHTTFFLVHRTGMTVGISEKDVTRDDFWEITGSLYDIDTALNDGLPGETITIYIGSELMAQLLHHSTVNLVHRSELNLHTREEFISCLSYSRVARHLPVEINQTALSLG